MKPTDEQILKAISKNGQRNAMTYVIANILRMDGFKGLDTSFVLRRLKLMKLKGMVENCEGFYKHQYCWKLKD